MAASACALSKGGATTDPGMCRLLTSDLGLGTTDNPLAGTWMQAVLAHLVTMVKHMTTHSVTVI